MKKETAKQKAFVRAAIKQIREHKSTDLARDHAWQIWSLVSEAVNAGAEDPNNPKSLPKWFTWCTDDEVENLRGSADCLVASKPGNSQRQRNPRPTKFMGVRGVSSAFQLFEFEEVYASPNLANALRKWKQAAPGYLMPPALFGLSIAVKAQYRVLQHPRNRRVKGPNGDPFVPIWDGAPRLSRQLSAPGLSWARKAVVALPEKGRCEPEVLKDPAPKPNYAAEKAQLTDFFYFQYCGDENYGFNLAGGSAQSSGIARGDYVVLTGLHIITNLADPAERNGIGEWTWSTFYWHPDRENKTKKSDLSPRAESLQKQPKKLQGWRGNYRMDLQYTRHEEIAPDPLVARFLADVKKSGEPLPCGLTSETPPAAVFNPYIEGVMECGVVSNCVSCHSHAVHLHKVVPSTATPATRYFVEPPKKTSAHFLWSLAMGMVRLGGPAARTR